MYTKIKHQIKLNHQNKQNERITCKESRNASDKVAQNAAAKAVITTNTANVTRAN